MLCEASNFDNFGCYVPVYVCHVHWVEIVDNNWDFDTFTFILLLFLARYVQVSGRTLLSTETACLQKGSDAVRVDIELLGISKYIFLWSFNRIQFMCCMRRNIHSQHTNSQFAYG